jgi:hypothetical protein
VSNAQYDNLVCADAVRDRVWVRAHDEAPNTGPGGHCAREGMVQKQILRCLNTWQDVPRDPRVPLIDR